MASIPRTVRISRHVFRVMADCLLLRLSVLLRKILSVDLRLVQTAKPASNPRFRRLIYRATVKFCQQFLLETFLLERIWDGASIHILVSCLPKDLESKEWHLLCHFRGVIGKYHSWDPSVFCHFNRYRGSRKCTFTSLLVVLDASGNWMEVFTRSFKVIPICFLKFNIFCTKA